MKGGGNTEVIFIILFYLLCSLISLATIYSNDIADIASGDFETYYPSIEDLPEEERINTYKIDDYIKNTVCKRYHHQILKKDIEYYQNKYIQHYYISVCAIHLFLFKIAAQLSVNARLIKNFPLAYLISTIIGTVIYYLVKLLYKKYWCFNSLRIKNYYNSYSLYDWYDHYCYLLSIEQTVIFRYALRRIFEFLAGWVYFLFFFRPTEY